MMEEEEIWRAAAEILPLNHYLEFNNNNNNNKITQLKSEKKV